MFSQYFSSVSFDHPHPMDYSHDSQADWEELQRYEAAYNRPLLDNMPTKDPTWADPNYLQSLPTPSDIHFYPGAAEMDDYPWVGSLDHQPSLPLPLSPATTATPPAEDPVPFPSPESSNRGPDKPQSRKKRASDSSDASGNSNSRRRSNPTTRVAHHIVEQRYRRSVNAAIQSLQDTLPEVTSREGDGTTEPVIGGRPSSQTKGAILNQACKYIRHLQRENERLQVENNTLREPARMYIQGLMGGSIVAQGPCV